MMMFYVHHFGPAYSVTNDQHHAFAAHVKCRPYDIRGMACPSITGYLRPVKPL